MTEQTKKIVKKFGVEDISDVCLVVGNAEFHVHKPVLACQSKVFMTMFYGDSNEKNKYRIEISDADPLAFQRILEMIYNQEISDESFLRCRYSGSSEAFWEQSTALWKLIDRFDIPVCQKTFIKLLEKYCSKKVSSFLVARLTDEPKSLKAIDFMQRNNFCYRISTNSTLLNLLMSSSGAEETRLAAEQLENIFEPRVMKVEYTGDENDDQKPAVIVNSVENHLEVNAQLSNEQPILSDNDFWAAAEAAAMRLLDDSDDVVKDFDENKESVSMGGDSADGHEKGDHDEDKNEEEDSDEDHEEKESDENEYEEKEEENEEDSASDDDEDRDYLRKKNIQKRNKKSLISRRLMFACPARNCLVSCGTFKRFLEHMKTHSDKENFFCDVCKKDVPSKTEAKRHLLGWMKKGCCCACQKTYKTRQGIRLHLRLHTSGKPYACGYCKKRFSYSSSLKAHEVMHTGDAPYKCGYCNRRFTYKRYLIEHERGHTGERPYACKKCNKTYASASALYTHNKIKHNLQKKKP